MHAAPGHLHLQRDRKHPQRRLHRIVRPHARHRDISRRAGNIDHRSPRRRHTAEQLLRQRDRREKIQFHLPPQLRVGKLLPGRVRADPGIVDQHVHRSEARFDLLRRRPQLLRIGQIGRDELIGQPLCRSFPAQSHDMKTVPAELRGHRRPEPAGSPGDHRCLFMFHPLHSRS